jgi:ATP-dependent Clp protease ATP-binding subunit ClpB
MEKHTVARLLGAPPGYIGYDEGGQLTEAVRRRPYAVVLFDEIEKAHPDVFNVLLQVLDDGRLTDGKGRTVDFRNTVLIMTSNVASDLIQEMAQSEGDDDRLKNRLMDALRRTFRPEFLNRIDEVVIFQSLKLEDLVKIVNLELDQLRKALAERHLDLEITPAARRALAEQGYDPVYGARPLKRLIQRQIVNPVALGILKGEYRDGQVVEVDFAAKRGFVFRALETGEPVAAGV